MRDPLGQLIWVVRGRFVVFGAIQLQVRLQVLDCKVIGFYPWTRKWNLSGQAADSREERLQTVRYQQLRHLREQRYDFPGRKVPVAGEAVQLKAQRKWLGAKSLGHGKLVLKALEVICKTPEWLLYARIDLIDWKLTVLFQVLHSRQPRWICELRAVHKTYVQRV